MTLKVPEYSEEYNWVEAEALKNFNLDRRPWTGRTVSKLVEGETYVVPRRELNFFFENGFFTVVDENPDVGGVKCGVCGDTFENERGLKSHRQVHQDETDKNDEQSNRDSEE